jgi:hypothetical protein
MTYLSETRELYLRINPCRIHYLKFLLEGYDGMAILSTRDVQSGLVVVRYPSYSQEILFELLADLAVDLTRET